MKFSCCSMRCVFALLLAAIIALQASICDATGSNSIQRRNLSTDTNTNHIGMTVNKRKTSVRRTRKLRRRRQVATKSSSSSSKKPSTSTKAPKSPSESNRGSSTRAPVMSTKVPTVMPTKGKTAMPSGVPTFSPSSSPITLPSGSPTFSLSLTNSPSSSPINFPSTHPTAIPSIRPTDTPSSSPTVACVLKAKLGYPDWKDPDDATYMGYHTDYLEVWYNVTNYCDAWTSQPWCTYENSNGPGNEMTYISNVDDFYYPEEAEEEDAIQEEYITVHDAANKTTNFNVYHVFAEKDYYYEYQTWSDHVMAANLTVTNDSTRAFVSDEGGNVRWAHQVDKDIRTHTEDNEQNPDYQGNFGISVTCDAYCDCIAHDYTTNPANYYYIYYDE